MKVKLEKIKIKINGVCMNKCSFCQFNSNSDRLSTNDISQFWDKIHYVNYSRFDRIVINGGEPTIHPEFNEITNLLYNKFKEKKILQLGTNLKLFERNNQKTKNKLDNIFNSYQKVSIGCDDEHNNIQIVEKLVPEFFRNGIKVNINSVIGYSSKSTKNRLLKLKDQYGVNLMFSPLAHYYLKKTNLMNNGLCRDRRRDFLIDCNGNAFYCYQQELENPLFNIHEVNSSLLNYYLFEFVPNYQYKFCKYCERFIKERF
jgi:GTP 3',8-cyclase